METSDPRTGVESIEASAKLKAQRDDWRSSDNLELWRAVANLRESESDRFWSRNNVLLVVNGGLLVLLARVDLDVILGMLTAFLGLVLASIWLRVNRVGKQYVDRWEPILLKLELGWPVRPISLSREGGFPAAVKHKGTTTYMNWLINLVGGFWFVVLGYCGLRFFGEISVEIGNGLARLILAP